MMLNRILNRVRETQWQFKRTGSTVRICRGAQFVCGRNVTIRNSDIWVAPGSKLLLGDNVVIQDITMELNGVCTFESDVKIIGNSQHDRSVYLIQDGHVYISNHALIDCQRVWLRFGGKLYIGEYTNINHGSEIRSDENVTIGSYNQISYNVRIWDTNTHAILPPAERRLATQRDWPFIGKEHERPATRPVVIGDDCWLGERVSILKGTTINNEVIIGYNTTIVGKVIPEGKKVVADLGIRIM